MPPKRKIEETILDDEAWVEEEGRKLTDGELQELLRNAPVSDGHSRPLEEVMAEMGIDLDGVDDED